MPILAVVVIASGIVMTARAEAHPLRVFYLGPDNAVKQALTLTEATPLTTTLTGAEAAVLVGTPNVPPDQWLELATFVRDGGGLVVFMTADLDVTRLAALGLQVPEVTLRTDAAVLQPQDDVTGVLDHINWQAAPQVRDRSVVADEAIDALVRAHGTEEVLIGECAVGQGRLFLVTPHVDSVANRPFCEWFYFNYLVYALAARAAGEAPVPFADYPGSPLPHKSAKTGILFALATMILGTLGVFAQVRRYSLRHPELLRHLVRDKERFRVREGGTEWEHVGFHRAIASLMPGILNNIWLFVLISFVINRVLFGLVMPSAQVRGALSLVATFFATIWTLLDWGTSVAGMKFLSQYRVSDPGEGIKYVQLFVWWQAITGTLQVGAVVLVAIYILPNTSLAYLSLFIVVHTLIQFPGFFTVFNSVAMPGLHRFDYPQMINFIMSLVTPLIQVVVCLGAVAWGRSHPVYDGVAGGLGLGAAGLVSGFLSFALGFWLYRRLGLSARVIFLAHFDWKTTVSALKFGAPIMAAGLLYGGAYSIQVMILSNLVLNYAEVQANFDVVCSVGLSGLVFPFVAIQALTNSLTNSFSEAYAVGKRSLCRYYVTMSVKWGHVLAAFLVAVLFAVGDRYILGTLGVQYERASEWIRWFSIWAFLTAFVWTTDQALIGIGRPGLSLISMVVEQGVRIVLMFLLASRLQAFALVAAYMVALPCKALANLYFVRREMDGLTVNWWQSLFAPILAALGVFFALRYLGDLYWTQDSAARSLALFATGLILAFPPYFFMTGLLGGWDDFGLDEFRRAVPMSNVGRPLAAVLLRCTEWGARWSPLHNRFPTRTHAEAMREADELTRLKVPLDEYGIQPANKAEA